MEGLNKLPQEVVFGEKELKTNGEGKKYEYEKDGTFYGGDYLNEIPEEINFDLPSAPEEKNSIL